MFALEDQHFWFAGKRAAIAAALAAIPIRQPARVIDVGCGTGGTTQFLKQWGSVTGIERNTQAAALARSRGLEVIEAGANELPLPSQCAELVTFLDVLYHTGVDESRALAEAHRVLKSGGHVLITDCAMPSLWTGHDVAVDAKYRYTKPQLVGLVERAGFEIDTAQYLYASTFPLFAASRVLARLAPKRRTQASREELPLAWINRLLTGVLKLEAALPIGVPRPFGSSILVLAHKQ